MSTGLSFNEGMFYDGMFDETQKHTIARSNVGLLAAAFYKLSFGELRVVRYFSVVAGGESLIAMATRHGAPCLQLQYSPSSGYTVKNWTVQLLARGKDKYVTGGKTIAYALSKFKKGNLLTEIINKKNQAVKELMSNVQANYIKLLPSIRYSFDEYGLSRAEYRVMFDALLNDKPLTEDSFSRSKLNRALEAFEKFDAKASEMEQEVRETFQQDFFIIAHYRHFVGVGVYHYTLDNKLVDTIPFRLYKSFDCLPDEMRERLRIALTMCRLNREQTGVHNEVNVIDNIPCAWDRKIYRDTTSLSFGSVDPAKYQAAWFVTPY